MAHYKKIDEIGSGGFGIVYRARRTEDNAIVAMKVLSLVDNVIILSRFHREVRAQSTLNHPNVVHIIGRNLNMTPPWFVMELAHSNLRDILPDIKGKESDIVDIFRQILAGIKHAHDNGVVHRDLKPENILIYNDVGNNVRISDFGIAKLDPNDTTTLTAGSEGLGTPQYAAPEQWAAAHDADARADIYALGKLLYEMLTGIMPFPILKLECVDSKFRYIIQKCVENEPDQRFQSIEELRQQFELAIRPAELLDRPIERVRNILEGYIFADTETRAIYLTELTNILEMNPEDNELYTTFVPRFPDNMISDIIEQHSASFMRIIEIFDEHVKGALLFSYTDVVASFYRTVYGLVDNLRLKRIVLARLLYMGVSHNRWYVMDVTANIINCIQDIAEAQNAVEILGNDSHSTRVIADRLIRSQLHQIIRSKLDQMNL